MQLGELVERAVCITVASRWPVGFASVREQLARRGVPMTALLNGPAASLPPPSDDVQVVPHEGEPPASYWGTRGSWWHRVAFRHIVRQALEDRVETLLIAEDDALFVEDADAILARVELCEDWAMLYLGAMHAWGTTEPAGPYLVRTHGARAVHSVIYRRASYEALLSLPAEGPIDHEIAVRLHGAKPCYAVWPNAVIQAEGISTMTGGPTADAGFFERGG